MKKEFYDGLISQITEIKDRAAGGAVPGKTGRKTAHRRMRDLIELCKEKTVEEQFALRLQAMRVCPVMIFDSAYTCDGIFGGLIELIHTAGDTLKILDIFPPKNWPMVYDKSRGGGHMGIWEYLMETLGKEIEKNPSAVSTELLNLYLEFSMNKPVEWSYRENLGAFNELHKRGVETEKTMLVDEGCRLQRMFNDSIPI